MKNNPHYLALMRKARNDHLANIRNVSNEIADLYTYAAKDLAKRAAAAPKGSLNERWAAEYSRSLSSRAAELRAGLYETIYQGLKRSADLPAAAMGEFWYAVGGESFRDMFASTPDDVLTQIISGGFYKDNKGLSERIWRIANDFEDDISYIVNRGIVEHKSAYELARDLEQYVKDPARRDWDWGRVYPNLSGKRVDYNAQRLARTAINHSYFVSNVKQCKRNPYVEAMHWELSAEHDERQVKPFGPDECDDYAAHEEGLGEGNFPPERIPTPHPQCLCAQWGVMPKSLEEIGAEIGDWIAGAPNPKLDAWYEKYGGGFDKSSLISSGSGGKINLTESESAAVNAYISSESYRINEKLRSGMDLSEDETEIVYNLDSALKKMPRFEGTVYRSMSSDMVADIDNFWLKHQLGNWVIYDAYTSVSLEVYDESMDIQCVIKSKNGRDITAYNPNEREIIFARGSCFIITDVQGNTIFMEER